LKRVKRNKGSAGVDGMSVGELPAHLKLNLPAIKVLLLSGEYVPQLVRRVEIPKPGKLKEKRKLGIPTVIDRFIQQAFLQVLQRSWDQTFSENSYGFCPGRSAHQAIAKAQEYAVSGYGVVVDIDLAAFFDRFNHDQLMSKLAKDIENKHLLELIRRYLQAGILENGLIRTPTQGTSQGSPLSPFLSNVVLDEWNKELEVRGHSFVRYGDYCNIYVKSHRAGERVKASATRFITQ
jgi:RNA-directed DNA polymerase